MTVSGEADVPNSFGSFIFPAKRPELLDYLVTSLLAAEPPLPFVLTLPSADAILPDETLRAVEQSGKGLICSWAPQPVILNHPATAFFIVSLLLRPIRVTLGALTPVDTHGSRKHVRSDGRGCTARHGPARYRSAFGCRRQYVLSSPHRPQSDSRIHHIRFQCAKKA